MSHDRIRRAQAALRDHGVDALLVGPSADLRFLTGYHALPLERMTLLVVPAEGDAELLVPELEAPRAKASGAGELLDLRTWSEAEDPVPYVAAILRDAGVQGGTLAVQDRLWTVFTLRLQAGVEADAWIPGSTIMRDLRVVKQAEEVEALRNAGAAIDRIHQQVPGQLRPGRTEAEVGRDIAELMLENHDEANFVIVASGPNGASPHHETGERRLEEGDAIVVDIGGTLAGYCSDMTRNYVLGTVPDGYRELHDVLLAAQKAGVAAVAPGVPAEAVDAAARDVIEDAGYGEYFVHRTGHGIGVEEHEEPWIIAGNDEPLVAGMTFSVEPGIYIPGRYGARIEDIVAVTEDGVRRLNVLDRDLVEVTW